MILSITLNLKLYLISFYLETKSPWVMMMMWVTATIQSPFQHQCQYQSLKNHKLIIKIQPRCLKKKSAPGNHSLVNVVLVLITPQSIVLFVHEFPLKVCIHLQSTWCCNHTSQKDSCETMIKEESFCKRIHSCIIKFWKNKIKRW